MKKFVWFTRSWHQKLYHFNYNINNLFLVRIIIIRFRIKPYRIFNFVRFSNLGVVLDRSPTYKVHCEKTKMKINTRNRLLRKLVGSAWGAKSHALRVTALTLCFSTCDLASQVWGSPAHTKQIGIALNETCRLITGCLTNIPVNKLYTLFGIAPPEI
jgi:hypothetical protein